MNTLKKWGTTPLRFDPTEGDREYSDYYFKL
jgi:hypothetical protein